MTTTTPAYGAVSATAPLQPLTIERRAPGPHDVHIETRYCGICHSDLHSARGEWGPQEYPLVPGHEITGVVTAVGTQVTRHAPGDRVGVGVMVDACRECGNCAAGLEQHCLTGTVDTYAATDRDGTRTQGGYSAAIVVHEDFVFRIPGALPLDAAAPLLCAGLTTYSPLRHWNAGPGTRVAVVGLGGLGHMAVKLAAAMGAEVTVLSQTLAKRESGLQLGATDYRATSDAETFTDLTGRFDLILNTVSAPVDLPAYLGLLRTGGTMVALGWPEDLMQVNMSPLISGRRSLAGSLTGGLPETQEMLDFCAEHAITPDIELVRADQINEAWERMMRSDVRYRFVIDLSTLANAS